MIQQQYVASRVIACYCLYHLYHETCEHVSYNECIILRTTAVCMYCCCCSRVSFARRVEARLHLAAVTKHSTHKILTQHPASRIAHAQPRYMHTLETQTCVWRASFKAHEYSHSTTYDMRRTRMIAVVHGQVEQATRYQYIPTRKVVLGSEKARIEWGRCTPSISKHSVASELQLAPGRPALPRGRTTLPCTVRGSSPLFRLGTDDMAVLPRCGIGGGMFAVHNLKV